MNKNVIILIVLGVLVLVSAVQAVQLNDLRTKVASGELNTGAKTGASPSSGSSGGAASVPSNIQNLPGMVGGC